MTTAMLMLMLMLTLTLTLLMHVTYACVETPPPACTCRQGYRGRIYLTCTVRDDEPWPSFAGFQSPVETLRFIGLRTELPAQAFASVRARAVHLSSLGLREIHPSAFHAASPHIRELHLDDNHLDLLPDDLLTSNPSLVYLTANSNNLTRLPDMVGDLPLSLRYLYARDNRITAIPEVVPASLRTLSLSYNLIREVATSTSGSGLSLSSLREVDLSNNQLTTLRGSDYPATLERLSMAANKVGVANLVGVPGLRYLDLSGNLLIALELAAVPSLAHLDLAGNLLTSAPAEVGDLVRTLVLSGNRIRSLDFGRLASAASLRRLDVSDNELRNLTGVAPLPRLVSLLLAGNRLSRLPKGRVLLGHNDLHTVDLSRNRIQNLDDGFLTKLNGMYELNLSNNNLTSIQGRHLPPRVNVLHLSTNRIASVDLDSVSGLSSLLLDRNRLTAVPRLLKAKGLRLLDISHNRIEKLDRLSFRGLRDIRILRLSDNNITGVLVNDLISPCKRLQILDLSGNKLTSVFRYAFYNGAALSQLNLNRNRVAFLSSACFRYRTRLTDIRLSDNRLRSLHVDTFSDQTRLRYLDLAGNPLSDLQRPLALFPTTLTELDITGSLLNCADCELLAWVRVHREILRNEAEVTCRQPIGYPVVCAPATNCTPTEDDGIPEWCAGITPRVEVTTSLTDATTTSDDHTTSSSDLEVTSSMTGSSTNDAETTPTVTDLSSTTDAFISSATTASSPIIMVTGETDSSVSVATTYAGDLSATTTSGLDISITSDTNPTVNAAIDTDPSVTPDFDLDSAITTASDLDSSMSTSYDPTPTQTIESDIDPPLTIEYDTQTSITSASNTDPSVTSDYDTFTSITADAELDLLTRTNPDPEHSTPPDQSYDSTVVLKQIDDVTYGHHITSSDTSTFLRHRTTTTGGGEEELGVEVTDKVTDNGASTTSGGSGVTSFARSISDYLTGNFATSLDQSSSSVSSTANYDLDERDTVVTTGSYSDVDRAEFTDDKATKEGISVSDTTEYIDNNTPIDHVTTAESVPRDTTTSGLINAILTSEIENKNTGDMTTKDSLTDKVTDTIEVIGSTEGNEYGSTTNFEGKITQESSFTKSTNKPDKKDENGKEDKKDKKDDNDKEDKKDKKDDDDKEDKKDLKDDNDKEDKKDKKVIGKNSLGRKHNSINKSYKPKSRSIKEDEGDVKGGEKSNEMLNLNATKDSKGTLCPTSKNPREAAFEFSEGSPSVTRNQNNNKSSI